MVFVIVKIFIVFYKSFIEKWKLVSSYFLKKFISREMGVGEDDWGERNFFVLLLLFF